MADLLDSHRVIDSGVADAPVNRVTQELSSFDDLAIVESFSHSVVIDSGEGLIAFDTSAGNTGRAVVDEIARWRPAGYPSHVHTAMQTMLEEVRIRRTMGVTRCRWPQQCCPPV